MVSPSTSSPEILSSCCTCSSRRAKHGHISFRIARSALELASFFSRDRFNTIITNHLRPTQVAGYVVLIYSTYTSVPSDPEARLESIPHDLQYMLDHLGYTHGNPNFFIITNFDFIYKDYEGDTALVDRREMTKGEIEATIRDASQRSGRDHGLIVYGGHAVPRPAQAIGVEDSPPVEYQDDQYTALNPLPDLYIYPWDLRRWLPDKLQEGTKTVLLLDACHIGTFVPAGAVLWDYSNVDSSNKSPEDQRKSGLDGSGALLVLSAANKDQMARGVMVQRKGRKYQHSHGAFSYELLGYLSENRRPRLSELANFLGNRLHHIPLPRPDMIVQSPTIAASRPLSWLSFKGLTW